MPTHSSLYAGLSAFPPTPADESGRVDADALAALVDRLCVAGVDSIGLLGSTGVYAYLSRAERLRAVRAAVEVAAGRMPLMVGVGALRTDEAVALARDAVGAGADALLLAPVSYTPLAEAEVFEHVRAVAEAGGRPLCLYNNPSTTHFSFSHELIRRLAVLPDVAAVKMPLPVDGDVSGELAVLRAGPQLSVGYSGDWGCAAALLAGADAWYSVAGGLLPKPALALARAAQAGDGDETARLDGAFAPLWALFRAHGSLRVVYAMMAELGLGTFHPPRPILPLGPEARTEVAQALEALH